MNHYDCYLADEAATTLFARTLLSVLPDDLGGWTILLSGDLGAGKSTFARALIQAAGHAGPVPSPTYTLIEPYALSRGNIYHIDLYRVNDESELHFLGWNDLDDGCRLVEWPERVPGLSESADLALSLQYEGSGRLATLTALSDAASGLIQKIK